MAPPPPSDVIDFFPSIVPGAPTHTAHDPNVAIHTPLGTVVDQYRPSKPITMATAVANQQPTMEGCY
eukprot:scaffold62336_cov35-Attheya_sp.AAC.2